MNKIASFTVNHLNLLPGVYVSRRDYIGSEVVTTFDLRFTRPNLEPPMGGQMPDTGQRCQDRMWHFPPVGWHLNIR